MYALSLALTPRITAERSVMLSPTLSFKVSSAPHTVPIVPPIRLRRFPNLTPYPSTEFLFSIFFIFVVNSLSILSVTGAVSAFFLDTLSAKAGFTFFGAVGTSEKPTSSISVSVSAGVRGGMVSTLVVASTLFGALRVVTGQLFGLVVSSCICSACTSAGRDCSTSLAIAESTVVCRSAFFAGVFFAFPQIGTEEIIPARVCFPILEALVSSRIASSSIITGAICGTTACAVPLATFLAPHLERVDAPLICAARSPALNIELNVSFKYFCESLLSVRRDASD